MTHPSARSRTRLIAAGLFMLAYFFWPAAIAGLAAAAAWKPWYAIIAGILLDIVYGAPPAPLFGVPVTLPFTALAIALALSTHFGKKFVTAGEWRIRVGR